MNFNVKFIIVGVILIIGFSIFGIFELVKKPNITPPQSEENPSEEVETPTEEIPGTNVLVPLFDYKIIKEVNKNYSENYLVSPLSMAYALTILKEGAKNNTKSQLSILLNNYQLKNTYEIKDKISIANALFIKESEKENIYSNYITKVKNTYNSEIIFDDFSSPKTINDWVYKKTYKMIEKTVDYLSPESVLAIVNAIAIDVEWKNKFECERTHEDEFTLYNNKTMKTPMMNSSDDVYYIESDKAKGIIKDYKIYDKKTGEAVYEPNNNTVELEYIAILPNGDIKDYVNKLDNTELTKLINSKKQANDKLSINYSIPKYTYDFDYSKFKQSLVDLGASDMFEGGIADFTNMADKRLGLFVSQAIHKTHIEFSENGTKAAAVTAIIMDKNAIMIEPKEEINIKFNKPFVYIIKEKNSNNIWFFGTVYEPMKWEDNKPEECEKY